MPDAEPMAAQLGSTARRSRTLRRTEAKIGTPRIARPRILKPTGTHGSGNWRKSSGRRLIDRKRSVGSTFRSRTARKCDLWGIATIRDRVVQTAAMLVLEPIF